MKWKRWRLYKQLMFTVRHMTANAAKHWLGLWLCLAPIASKKLLKPASVQSVSFTGVNSCVSVLRIEPSMTNKALLGLLKLCGFGSGFGMGMSLGGNVLRLWGFHQRLWSSHQTICCRWAELRKLSAKSLWECVSLVRDERVTGKENMSVVSRGAAGAGWGWVPLLSYCLLSLCCLFVLLFSVFFFFLFLTHSNHVSLLPSFLPPPTLHSPFVPLVKLLSGFYGV